MYNPISEYDHHKSTLCTADDAQNRYNSKGQSPLRRKGTYDNTMVVCIVA